MMRTILNKYLKVFCALLSLVLLVTMMPATAFAEGDTDELIHITAYANHENAHFRVSDDHGGFFISDIYTKEYQKNPDSYPWQYLNEPYADETAHIVFAGWSETPEGEPIEDIYSYNPGTDITLYAIWHDAVKITYHTNHEKAHLRMYDEEAGGDIQVSERSIMKEPDKWDIGIPEIDKGAKIMFAGWAEEPDGEPVDGSTYVPQGDTNLYAIWWDAAELTLHANNDKAYYDVSEFDETSLTYTTKQNSEMTTLYPKNDPDQFWAYLMAPNTSEDAKLYFKGWSESPNGKPIDTQNYTPTGDVELYAIWGESATITVYANNPDAYFTDWDGETQQEKRISEYTFTTEAGTGIYPTWPNVKNNGKILQVGWSRTPDGDLIKEGDFIAEDGMKLYAQWEEGILVTFHANNEKAYYDGETEDGNYDQVDTHGMIAKKGQTLEYEYSYPSLTEDDALVFIGWAETQNGEPVDEENYILEDGMHLYAVWADPVHITLYANHKDAYFEVYDDETDGEKRISEYSTIFPKGKTLNDYHLYIPETDESSDIYFTGWAETPNGKPVDMNTYIPKEGAKLYATWNYDGTQADPNAQAAAKAASAINSLPAANALTLNNKAAVMNAKAAYDALTSAQKALISSANYQKLQNAVAKINQLQKAADDAAAKQTAYEKAANAAKALKVKTIKVKAKAKKKAKVTWKAVSGADGYEIQYSLKKSFKKAKTVTVKGAKKKSATLKKLKAGKKYYVRIRPYTNVTSPDGKTAAVTGNWSKVKKIKVKK